MEKFKKLYFLIQNLFRKHYWFSLFVSFFAQVSFKSDTKMQEVIEQYAGDRLADKKYIRKLKRHLFASKLTYQIRYKEYFLFRFDELSDKGKREYIGDYERYYMLTALSTLSVRELFNKKYETYLRFKPYYHRDVIKVFSSQDRLAFDQFISTHKKVIAKPLDDSFGNGVFLIQTDTPDFSADDTFNKIISRGEYILEECIIQCEETAKFHPNSVNTLRIATFFDGNKTIPLFSFFRTGRGNQIVDNGGAGGIFTSVDVATGISITPGIDEDGNTYLCHPDSGEQMIGIRIPKWNEMLELLDQLARVVPEQQYVAWDLALTNSGWVMVEANSKGQFVQQYAEHKGCRRIMNIIYNKP